jgi:N-acetyl-anhydromuramyl-L-alanine amidase AmpD
MPPVLIASAPENFRQGRPAGLTPEAVVLHRTGGSRDLFRARFNDPRASLSAHYVVCRDGRVDQYVLETDTAFHAGMVTGATWRRLRPNVNPNFYTVGIELEGAPADDWPEAQVEATASLIADVAHRWNFAIDADHVVAHRAIRASSQCPADSCPMDRIIETARGRTATDVENPTEDQLSSPVDAGSGSTDAMELARRPAAASPEAPSIELPVDRVTLALPAKEFIPTKTPKDLVVLHFTAGRTARSAFDTWRNDPLRIATSYLVDTDGTIYEVFHPAFWAAHLGIKNTKNVHDRRSIGIEIANVGPLQRSADDPSVLNWWPPKSKGAPEFTTKFCALEETDRYVAAEYRGKSHFAAFPTVQVDAVAALVRGLCGQFSIPAKLPPLAKRFECDVTAFAAYSGVCTHANFRQDKWDIGPAFPWDRLGL